MGQNIMIRIRNYAGALAALAFFLPLGACQQAPAPVAVAQSAPVEHQRLLPLEGGNNFRDLGGYRAVDGRTVKWGVLFRSGAMNGLTDADFAYLRKLGIATVCDFRDNRERSQAPVHWPVEGMPHVFAKDYSMNIGAMIQTLTAPGLTGEKTAAMMADLYRGLPYDFADQYRTMFAQLLAHRVPLAFNCSAGKDRTGVAAALVLTALGVPRETVFEDFLLSNQYYDPTKGAQGNSAEAKFWLSLPDDVRKALMGVDRRYLEAAFDAIDKRSGGIDGYFKDELGLTPADFVTLRNLYLE